MVTKHIPSDVWKTKNVIFRLTQQKTGTTPDLFTYTRKISIYYTESPVFCQLKIYLSYSLTKQFWLISEIVSRQSGSRAKRMRFWYKTYNGKWNSADIYPQRRFHTTQKLPTKPVLNCQFSFWNYSAFSCNNRPISKITIQYFDISPPHSRLLPQTR